jgi:hypothetical protein
MWRRTMVVMSLIAVLSGTPLRQAANADDYARSIDDYGQRHVLDTPDGQVGDDEHLSLLDAGSDTHSLTAANLWAIAHVYVMPPSPFLSLPHIVDHRWADLSGSLPACPGRRSAWLQCFLF